MPKASHAAQLREAILNCLADGSPHSIAEIRASVAAQDPSLLSPGRRFSGVLYDWGQADPRLQHPKKGYYSYLAAPSSSPPTESPAEGSAPPLPEGAPSACLKAAAPAGTLTVQDVAACWQAVCEQVERQLKAPSYDMTAAEFTEYQKVHRLNQQIRSLLQAYLG